jgi:TonB-linked SusC/RagA family outer membrane protein
MKKLSLALVLALFSISAMLAQRTIMGTVTGDDGSALIGATVLVKGTSSGTITDIDGKYTLRVPSDDAVLVFSFTGYSTEEVTVGTSNVVDITLKVGQVLGEVVVTALGISKDEKAIGYAVQSVDNSELLKANETNLIQSLAGKVAGLQVTGSTGAAGGSSFFLLRGFNTINGNNQPLIVVDGVPIDNQQLRQAGNEVASVAFSNRAVDINQNDIESVTVLKSAAATALYGSLAGNGAIIITTKRGKSGAQKVSVDFSSNLTFSEFNKVPELQNTFSQGSAGAYAGPHTRSAFSWGARVDTLRYTNADYVLTPAQDVDGDGVYDWDRNGYIVGQSSPFASGNAISTYNPYDFFQTGISSNNNLAITAANANSSLRFSVGYTNETGIIPNNDFERLNFGLNADTRLGDKVKMGLGVQYINSGGTRIEQGSNVSGVMLGLLRTTPTFDNSAGLSDVSEDNNGAYQFPDGRPRGYRGINPANGSSIYDNPYWTAFNNPLEDKVNRVIGNFNLSYDPTPWLNISWRPGIDFYSDNRKQYFAISSASYPAGQVTEDQYFNKRWNSDLIATFKKDLSDQIGMSLAVGHNIREFRTDNLYTQGDGLVIPGFYDLSNASSVRAVADNSISRNQGVYGVLDLDYNNWLYVSGTLRNEKDLSLPEDNNSYWYYSASGSVVLTELLGIQNNPALSFAKIRASYGRVGLGTFAYSTATYYTQGGYADGWTNGINFPFAGNSAFTLSDVLGNPNLKPEFRDSWELGADLRFLRNRVGLDVTYYNSVSKDIIISAPVTASSGFGNTIVNAAQLSNKGIEVVLSATPVKTNDFSWDLMVNFTRNRNSIDKLADGVDQVFLGGFTGASTRAVVGVPYGSIFGFGFYKDADGNTVIDGREFLPDGSENPDYLFPIIDPNEKAFKSALPDFTVGIRNSISYKGITLSALLDIKQGGYVWNGTKGALYYFGTHQETAELRNQPKLFEGNLAVFDADGNLALYDHDDDAKTPDIPQTSGANSKEVVITQANWLSTGNGNGFFGNNTEDFVEEASWVRLRDVSISYSLPKNLLSKAKISSLTVTLSGRNLWLDTPYTGIDPETNLYGASNAQGLDYFNMPGTKSYTIGLQVGF